MNENRITTRSHYLGGNTSKYGRDNGVRAMVGSLRYKRQKDRYWYHPMKFTSLEFNETKDRAIATTMRAFGWLQRNHEYVWTRDNVDIEHTCTWGITEFVKEDGVWKVAHSGGKLGLFEVGPYNENLYGDLV